MIDKAQGPVNKALDWAIHGAITLVTAAGKFVKGLFGKKDQKEPTHADDPVKAAKIQAGLLALDKAISTHEKNGSLTKEAADQIASDVRRQHPVFSAISVHDKADKLQFTYTASPEEPGPEVPKAGADPEIPRKHAPGIGDAQLHGEQGSRHRKGPKIHHTESEHLIPFRIGAMLWEELGLPKVARKSRLDRGQTTITGEGPRPCRHADEPGHRRGLRRGGRRLHDHQW